MSVEDTINFLKLTPPFMFADETELENIARTASLEQYPKGTFILRQGGEPSKVLRVIKKGSARVSIITEEGTEALTDIRGEGDLIGYLSLFGEDKARANVVTVEDTTCYLIPREVIQRLIETNPTIRDFFNKTFLTKYLDKPVSEIYDKRLMNIGSDKLLFTTTVGEIATKGVISAFEDVTIKEAAEIMSLHKISSLVIIDSNAVPIGIITNSDLRDRVVSKGIDLNQKVTTVMTATLKEIDAKEYCFEALLKMTRHNIHHLLVVDEGKLKGIITNHDLMLLQGISPINIARDIENQFSIDGLASVSKKTHTVVKLLLKEGVRASSIAKIITELNDRLVRKILQLAENKFGQPPVRYCWIVYGSEGRREQTFKTDQDNAIILEDYDRSKEEAVQSYFSSFSSYVRGALLRCGYAICPLDNMASNPKWRQPLSQWRFFFEDLITQPTQDTLFKSLIFFDFRPLYGERPLAFELREHVTRLAEANRPFLSNLAGIIAKNRPPIGFLKDFVVEKTGEHKDKLNLKTKGTAMIVDLARLFALDRGIKETSTTDRLESVKNSHEPLTDNSEGLQQVFDFLMLLRTEHQLAQIEKGQSLENFINPNHLSTVQRKMLKESYNLVSRIQDVVIERYSA